MRILLCNDDGIHAPGITALYDALTGHTPGQGQGQTPLAEVMVVAPLTVQSATGHGITFREPLMIRHVRVNDRMEGIAVDGRPADCVKLALSELWPARFGPGSRPDLVISGMNIGANVGINVLYSGTVAAALEAAFLGVPSIAVSLHIGRSRPEFDIAAQHARTVIERLIALGTGATGPCVSINIPITEGTGDAPAPPLPPLRVCPMNTHGMIDAFTRNTNPMGDVYFWSSGTPLEFHATEPGSDVQSLFERCITITPLTHDLTDHTRLAAMRGVEMAK
ncbi:MAG: 5'/3'-nucleotidase SurE [Phycisphaerales bacterium]|jgi:5'-nucleotidase|nr:5'/3'-nucleotidase SurE [Phycisphaerales bacterium]